jgi:DNA polymerase-1
MISLAWRDPDGTMMSYVFDARQDDEENLEAIDERLNEADKIIMHHAKFDIQKLVGIGVGTECFDNIDKWEDTQAMAHLIDEHRRTGLKYLAAEVLGESTDEDEVLKKYRRKAGLKKADGYESIPNEILAPYAAKDAEFTLRLYEYFDKQMDESLRELYDMEKELTLNLMEIEKNGLSVDRDYVKDKRREYGDRIYQTKARIAELSGPDFNPQSPAQVIKALAQRGVRVEKTDKATLSGLDDELATLIVELREANKIKCTYFDAIWEEATSGILHPHFRQHGTRTGRMSSGAAEES